MFDADRPIQKSEQDRLGRSTFAKYLARCILDHKNPESLVIGLYGGWGCGKTSVINLMLEELRYGATNMFDDERPIILNFSPWSYSGQNQLLYSFFRRLSSELRNSPFLENADKIIHLLELYVSFFTHQPVPKSLRPKHHFLTRLFYPQQTREETFGWEAGRDLTLVKAELNELLRQQKHKIIIIIDNIARIDEKEINQIFQIVKSIGDYANTIYLLAMDKEIVIRSIEKIYGEGGQDYLEKVVQLPFEIPAISKQDIENILLDRLQKIVSLMPEDLWDKEYWADVYYSTLKHIFENCRDITRYVNTLSFSYSRVKDIVNPVDFFAITALEVFEPAVYKGIRDNKDLFTDLMENVYEFNQEKLVEDKTRVDEILQRSEKISRAFMLPLCIRLFPRLRSIYQTDLVFFHSESLARKFHRICSPDVFDVYFRLSLPTGSISSAEMKALLSLSKDEEGFALELLRINQDERIPQFLDTFDQLLINQIEPENIAHVVSALIDSADLFPEGIGTLIQFDTADRIHRILHLLLRRLETSDARFHVLQKAIQKAIHSVYIIVHEIRLQEQTHLASEDTFIPLEQRDVTPEQLEALKESAVQRILYWASIGRLQEHPKLLPLLNAWREWGDEEACKRFVGQITMEDPSLLAFLLATLKYPIDQAMTKLEKNSSWEESLTNIENFISVRILEPHVKMLFEEAGFEKLGEREQLAILIFLDLIHAKTVKVIPKTTV